MRQPGSPTGSGSGSGNRRGSGESSGWGAASERQDRPSGRRDWPLGRRGEIDDRDEADEPFDAEAPFGRRTRSEPPPHQAHIADVDRSAVRGSAVRSLRLSPNATGAVVAVAIIGALAFFFQSRVPPPKAPPVVSPTAAVATIPGPSPTLAPTPNPVIATISLPATVLLPAFDTTSYDGTYIYLLTADGAIAVDPLTNKVATTYPGGTFPAGLRKLTVEDGLWASTWTDEAVACGPTCWPGATTYRIDPATGSPTLRLEGTYLLGSGPGGIWVAGGGRVRTLDPGTGKVVRTIPWPGPGEAVVACQTLWSIERNERSTIITPIDVSTGKAGKVETDAEPLQTGPFSADDGCWAMGVPASPTNTVWTLVRLNTSPSPASRIDERKVFATAVAILDGHVWQWSSDGGMLPVNPSTGMPGGNLSWLPPGATSDDSLQVFAAAGALWAALPDRLERLDIQQP